MTSLDCAIAELTETDPELEGKYYPFFFFVTKRNVTQISLFSPRSLPEGGSNTPFGRSPTK